MLGTVLFISLFALFLSVLAAHRTAWMREELFGTYRDGNKRQIAVNAVNYTIMVALLLLLYSILVNVKGVVQPAANWTLLAVFLVVSVTAGIQALNRQPSAQPQFI